MAEPRNWRYDPRSGLFLDMDTMQWVYPDGSPAPAPPGFTPEEQKALTAEPSNEATATPQYKLGDRIPVTHPTTGEVIGFQLVTSTDSYGQPVTQFVKDPSYDPERETAAERQYWKRVAAYLQAEQENRQRGELDLKNQERRDKLAKEAAEAKKKLDDERDAKGAVKQVYDIDLAMEMNREAQALTAYQIQDFKRTNRQWAILGSEDYHHLRQFEKKLELLRQNEVELRRARGNALSTIPPAFYKDLSSMFKETEKVRTQTARETVTPPAARTRAPVVSSMRGGQAPTPTPTGLTPLGTPPWSEPDYDAIARAQAKRDRQASLAVQEAQITGYYNPQANPDPKVLDAAQVTGYYRRPGPQFGYGDPIPTLARAQFQAQQANTPITPPPSMAGPPAQGVAAQAPSALPSEAELLAMAKRIQEEMRF